MSPDLFSYAQSFLDPNFSRTINLHIRHSYKRKALLLLFCIPIDLLIFFMERLFFGQRRSIIYTTKKWPEIYCGMKGYRKIFLGSPAFLFEAIKSRGLYLPASLIYVAIVIIWPRDGVRSVYSNYLIKISSFFLSSFSSNASFLVVHSDALPFARTLIFSAKNKNIKSVCLQHGILRGEYQTRERDGFMSDINIMRSKSDIDILQKINPVSKCYALPHFFMPNIINSNGVGGNKLILVGEGFHVIDENFSDKYIKHLRGLEIKLVELGYQVQYRPHPSEKFLYRSLGFQDYDVSSLESSLLSARAFIGYGSTLLAEASSVGVPSFYLRIDTQICNDMLDRNSFLNEFSYENLTKIPSNIEAVGAKTSKLKTIAIEKFYHILQCEGMHVQ